MTEIDVDRLRNWARAYQRLMQGGLSEQAHVACVDDFADDEGEFPYITAADVLALVARLAAVEALRDAYYAWDGDPDSEFASSPRQRAQLDAALATPRETDEMPEEGDQ